ncbi:site-specific DNA-methyltransferase [Clostridium botulinum]|nr:site-specific DNA-methyltransferase [Clostridium botulinum]
MDNGTQSWEDHPYYLANKTALDKLPIKSKRLLRRLDILNLMEARQSLSPRYCLRLINKQIKAEKMQVDETMPKIVLRCDNLTNGLEWIEVSCDLVCVDVPYAAEYIDNGLYHKIAEVSHRLLCNGGSLLVMVGSAHLPKAIASLDSVHGLNYHFDLVVALNKGGSSKTLQEHYNVTAQHKNILWFVKGEYKGELVSTLIQAAPPNKATPKLHPWQQDQHAYDQLLKRFVQKKNSVVADICMGSGTTIISAIRTGLCSTIYGVDCDKAIVATAKKEVKKELERIKSDKAKEQ